MNKNNLFLFLLLFSPSIVFAAAAPGKNVLQTAHAVSFDSKGFGEALGHALAKTQVGVNIDHKALGEALAQIKIGFNMDHKALGEALSQAKINIDSKQLQELAGSKEVLDAIANLKLIPANLTVNPVHFRLEQLPHVPVDLALKLSAENGRRMAGAAGATMATASILFCGAGATGYAFLAGSCAALYPEQAQQACRTVFNEHNYEKTKACCFATRAVAAASLDQCLGKCKKLKPAQADARRDN